MATTEDIEARLCAYVEGDLDPAQKSEIERHLQSHPQHRQMILDLVRTRRLIGQLPRQPAPVDLTEGLSGHLERAMLLNDFPAGGAHDPWSRRARRAPKILIKAAVFLLCAGLVAVVGALLHVASRPAQIADITQPAASIVPPPDAAPAMAPGAPTAMAVAIVPATQPAILEDAAAPATQPAVVEASPTTEPTTEPAVVAADAQPSPDAEISSSAILASLSMAAPTTLPSEFTVDISGSVAPPATQPAAAPADVADLPATRPVDEAPEPQ